MTSGYILLFGLVAAAALVLALYVMGERTIFRDEMANGLVLFVVGVLGWPTLFMAGFLLSAALRAIHPWALGGLFFAGWWLWMRATRRTLAKLSR